jgi:hypothetical protein
MAELPKSDDFKWFGEGFSGFPKQLPEDCLEFVVFVVNSKLNDLQTRERLQAFQRKSNELVKKNLKDYIWQRDVFKLDLERKDGMLFSMKMSQNEDTDIV